MKVKAKVAFAGIGFGAASGEVVDLPEAIAADVIQAGYADAVEEKTCAGQGSDQEDEEEGVT